MTIANIVGGPRDGGYEPMAPELDGCTAAVWCVPCSRSSHHHVYTWVSDRGTWKYAGIGSLNGIPEDGNILRGDWD